MPCLPLSAHLRPVATGRTAPSASPAARPTLRRQRKSSRVSVGDIARVAGVSKAVAGYALQNKPEVSPATRPRILRIARRLDYPGAIDERPRVHQRVNCSLQHSARAS